MNATKRKERMLELLADSAISGIAENEIKELEVLRKEHPEHYDENSFETIVSYITMLGISGVKEETLPETLRLKILSDAEDFFNSRTPAKETAAENNAAQAEVKSFFEFEKIKFFYIQRLGWALAIAACAALAVNVWMTRFQPKSEIVYGPTLTVKPRSTPPNSKKLQALLASAKDKVTASWTSPNKIKNFSGEVVWSDEKQQGFMKFKGLPVNDNSKETYQLWIFEETSLEKFPKDGGVFNININGEVIVPIDAKLMVKKPKAFAVTVEKPGGVVVSKREKIVALGFVKD